MEVEQKFHMNKGASESSYAQNSRVQVRSASYILESLHYEFIISYESIRCTCFSEHFQKYEKTLIRNIISITIFLKL
jgi:hypothetical protein